MLVCHFSITTNFNPFVCDSYHLYCPSIIAMNVTPTEKVIVAIESGRAEIDRISAKHIFVFPAKNSSSRTVLLEMHVYTLFFFTVILFQTFRI